MHKILYSIGFIFLIGCNNTASTQNSTAGNNEPHSIKTVKTQTKNQTPSNLKFGKYGCTASKYNNGSIEYIPRGSFTISPDGTYTYFGFKEPSSGTFIIDKVGNLFFKGGYFDGGKAEKIDRPNKFFLVFPTIPDNRWTCGWVSDK